MEEEAQTKYLKTVDGVWWWLGGYLKIGASQENFPMEQQMEQDDHKNPPCLPFSFSSTFDVDLLDSFLFVVVVVVYYPSFYAFLLLGNTTPSLREKYKKKSGSQK
jgi:hypothetical protein